jgi:hypothetical protein
MRFDIKGWVGDNYLIDFVLFIEGCSRFLPVLYRDVYVHDLAV